MLSHIIYGERGAVNSFKGKPEQVKALAHELYLQYMQVWEDNYGPKSAAETIDIPKEEDKDVVNDEKA